MDETMNARRFGWETSKEEILWKMEALM